MVHSLKRPLTMTSEISISKEGLRPSYEVPPVALLGWLPGLGSTFTFSNRTFDSHASLKAETCRDQTVTDKPTTKLTYWLTAQTKQNTKIFGKFPSTRFCT